MEGPMTPVLTSELQKESPVKQERLKQKKKNKKTTQHQSARWSAGLLVKNAGGNDLFLPMSIGPKILLFRLKFVLPYFWTEQRDMPKSVLRRLVISLE